MGPVAAQGRDSGVPKGPYPGPPLLPETGGLPHTVCNGVDQATAEVLDSEKESLGRGGSGAEGDHARGEQGQKEKVKRKKNYRRHAKPPYSYLALIALVIQNSPEKRLTLSQILKEISTLFPLFKGDYQGWKDSIRHNLSSNDCFRKVLKDPGKPQLKGNFWAVDVSRIPLEALKLQNTAIARQGCTILVDDLAPYILHGERYNLEGLMQHHEAPPGPPPCPVENDYPPVSVGKTNNSFMIDSLLQGLEGMSIPGKSPSSESSPQSTESQQYTPTGNGCSTNDHVWIPTQYLYSPSLSWRPSCSLGYTYSTPVDPRTFSSSSSLSTISSISSVSDDEKESRNIRQHMQPRKRPTKRPRVENGVSSSSRSDSEDTDDQAPSQSSKSAPLMPWELPTSYTKCVPPNAVAPPSAHPFFQFSSLPGLPNYSYKPAAYWGVMPAHRSSGQQSHRPSAPMDLDSMLQAVPPNKSVFDVWTSHPGDVLILPPFFGLPPFPNGTDLAGPRPF